MSDKDRILKEMRIQIYMYKQKNRGENPMLAISGKFYDDLLSDSLSSHNIKVFQDDKLTLLGCELKVFYSSEFDEFIIGKGFKVD